MWVRVCVGACACAFVCALISIFCAKVFVCLCVESVRVLLMTFGVVQSREAL